MLQWLVIKRFDNIIKNFVCSFYLPAKMSVLQRSFRNISARIVLVANIIAHYFYKCSNAVIYIYQQKRTCYFFSLRDFPL